MDVIFSFFSLVYLFIFTDDEFESETSQFDLMLSPVSPCSPPGHCVTLSTSGGANIFVHDLWFAYPSRPNQNVLRGVSLEISAGDTIGIHTTYLSFRLKTNF